MCSLLPVLAATLVLVTQLGQRVFIGPGLAMLESMSEDEQELKQPRTKRCGWGQPAAMMSI
jgi:hypothetical protein